MNIKAESLSFRYDKDLPLILNDVSFEIPEGSLTVLLGLNGCGKTTLIKLLAGLEIPNKGKIIYGDKELVSITIRDRSKVFAYVSQHMNVVFDIPVRQFLLYGTANTLKFYEHPGQEEIELVENIAERFQITHLLYKNLDQISGGELQICLIACALIQRTPIILLDEPTSALDLKNQNLVLSILKQIAEEEKKTIILSTHNPNHALFLQSDVILIKEGTIADHGKASEIVTVDKLKGVYGDSICLSKELDYKEVSFK